MTLAYITKRLSEEEEKKHDLVEGRQPSLYTRRVEAYTPPTLSPFRLLLDESAFLINLHRLCATLFYLLLPATGFHRLPHRLCHLVRLLPASTAFATAFATLHAYYRLPLPSATLRAHGP